MSNTWALTAVTASFSQLLRTHFLEDELLGDTQVTAERPFKAHGMSGRRLNLYLYQVAPNPALRNSDLPFRRSDGARSRQPVLALTLSYLLTGFGKSDEEFDAQHVLAHGMSIVHDNSVLTRERIRAAIKAYPAFTELARADLADQFEPVKLTPLPMTQEEHFKLWSTFQTAYRLSVGYEASVVMVERPLRAGAALPVRRPAIVAVGVRRPQIESVTPLTVPLNGTLTLGGRDLAGDDVRVVFASGETAPAPVTDTKITVVPPAELRAGVQTVRVVQRVALGEPPTSHRVFESNPAVFLRAPAIQSPQPPITVELSNDPTNQFHQKRPVTLTVAPPVARGQKVMLIAGERTIPREPPATADPTTTSLTFVIRRELLGEHLLRLQVDGAETPLTVEENPASPRFGEYVGPLLKVVSR